MDRSQEQLVFSFPTHVLIKPIEIDLENSTEHECILSLSVEYPVRRTSSCKRSRANFAEEAQKEAGQLPVVKYRLIFPWNFSS